jgi:signal transduction histidine kinase
LRRRLREITSVPERQQGGSVALTWRLAGFLAVLWAVVAVSVVAVSLVPALARPPDWVGTVLAGVLVTGLSLWSVPVTARGQGRWSAGVFFELAFAFTVGPPAIVVMALGHALGDYLRRRPGAIRTAFNTANHLLFNLAAWATFIELGGPRPSMPRALAAGIVGGLVALGVGTGLLGVVLGVATQTFHPRQLVSVLRQLLPWNIAFGFAAGGVSTFYQRDGALGLLVLLVPVGVVQMSLVATARRMHAEAEKDAAHAREREALLRREAQALRRAGDASEVERKRIAADLHDSVIQDVSGLFIRSSALLGRLSDGDADVWSRERVEGFLNYTRELAGEAVQELRTLMIELAPPLLDEEGLASALRQLLTRLDREQISWVLECTEERVDQRHQRLVYRVVQEALRNVIKHAQCHSVWVTVRPQGGRLVASIRDDGRGFSAAERADRRKKGHAGLGLLVQTVRDGGGELTITSLRGKGTTLKLSIPMLPSPSSDDADAGSPASTPAPDEALGGGGFGGEMDADLQGAEAERPPTERPIRRPSGRTKVTSTSVP